MNLNQVKQEAREEFDRRWSPDMAASPAIKAFLEETLDRLVDEIEEAVYQTRIRDCGNTSTIFDHEDYYLAADIREAFTRFKGESV